MATSSMIPYSNPAGVSQTAPASVIGTSGPGVTTGVVTANPLQPAAAAVANPLIPSTGITPQQVIPNTSGVGTPGATSVPVGTPTAQNAIDPAAYNQLKDIYGGSGDLISTLLGSISGTSSTALQEYINSLKPQEAQAQANLNASLGAGGVSANSSVAALGNANLQAQETAAIAGESAKLTMADQSLEAQLIESILPSAEKQTADSSPLAELGTILGDIGSVASDFMGLGGITGMFGGSKSSTSSTIPTSGAFGGSEDDLLRSINTIGIH
jgi:hypothetical protein